MVWRWASSQNYCRTHAWTTPHHVIIKEDVLPLSNHPRFEALAEVAKRGLLAPETWHCNRPYVSLKTTVDVPLPRHSHWAERRWMPGRLANACWMATTFGRSCQTKMSPPYHNIKWTQRASPSLWHEAKSCRAELRGCPMEAQGSLE